MLVLSRKIGEKIVVGDNITITVVEIKGNRVRIALEAPRDVPIMRSELNDCHLQDPILAQKPKEWHALEVDMAVSH